MWTNGEETTLTAELEAGWYRYVSQWTFHTNGTIKPRFGFAAVQNNCVCNVHHHHAYWRLDFDIGGAGRNFVQRSTATGWSVVTEGERGVSRHAAQDTVARGKSRSPAPL